MTDADKLAVQNAKGPSWKKVLVWIGVVLALVTGVTILLVALFRKKAPAAATRDIIGYAKRQSTKADVEAKIEVAQAREVEASVVKQLEQIKEIKGEEEQAKRLAELL